MSELTSDNVEAVIEDCLVEEITKDDPNCLIVRGIVHDYAFDKEKLESHREEIISWIDQLPEEFLADGGGGWSFLNLCMRKDEVQWTGLHWVQEHFLCMAMGLDLAKILLERELWSVLPGGMPYVVFTKEVPV